MICSLCLGPGDSACPQCYGTGVVDAVEWERAILRSWLLDPAGIPKVGDPEAVAVNNWQGPEANRRIANAIITLHTAGKPADFVSVGDYLRRRHELIGAGGMEYIADILMERLDV